MSFKIPLFESSSRPIQHELSLSDLNFERPRQLQAKTPIELLGKARDDVRLLVSHRFGNQHSSFKQLSNFLKAGDVVVVNDSATLPASLKAESQVGKILLNLSTKYGDSLWLAEPRTSFSEPEVKGLTPGQTLNVFGIKGHLLMQHTNLPRLWFVQFEEPIEDVMTTHGNPIRYAYTQKEFKLEHYQTFFSTKPGSAEMPSAARPFTQCVVDDLIAKGIKFASVTLHTGVSSLEIETENVLEHTLYAEPFEVNQQTASIINQAKQENRRIIAVGTTVIRALESAWNGKSLQPQKGFTKRYVHPQNYSTVADGLITGLHDPKASHLAMLYAVADQGLIQEAYAEAVKAKYLWHEFGDSHLILP